MVNQAEQTQKRKKDHLEPFRRGDVSARQGTTLLECVQLIHTALPQLSVDDISVETEYAGHSFKAPLFITGMTGGTAEAGEINRALAGIAQRMGIGFGLGSGRAMLENSDLTSTYQVRSQAPNVFVAWNLGGVQLKSTPLSKIKAALEEIEANSLCIHLNPAQEMMQLEGDRDFRGVLEAIEELIKGLDYPVIIKETGAGISRAVGKELRLAGVKYVDVAGRGGTSWVGVELKRQGREDDPELGAFWDWGIPTAASLCNLSDSGMELIASGGIRFGLDAARAISLGAKLVGVAAPVISAFFKDGVQGSERVLRGILNGLKTTMLLTGCKSLEELRESSRIISGPLLDWINSTAKNNRTGSEHD
jgi:isopentenyl-diphosphate Delta-isomerase